LKSQRTTSAINYRINKAALSLFKEDAATHRSQRSTLQERLKLLDGQRPGLVANLKVPLNAVDRERYLRVEGRQ
jgi:hypothetical protein